MLKNPFEIFGLTPELVAELPERELFGVLKSMYRALQKTFHPDMAGRRGKKAAPAGGGNGRDRAVELNLAFEALDLDKDPASFRKLRKVYASRRPASAYRNSLILQEKLNAQMEKEDRLAQSFLSYLAQAAIPAPGDGRDTPAVPLPARGIRLGLSDVAISNNIRQASWVLGSNYKQLTIDADGQPSVKPVGRSRFAKANYIHLLGCVPVESVELMPLLERGQATSFKSPSLPPGEGVNPRMSVLNFLNADNFKRHVLPLLRPVLLERAYLFSLNNDVYGNSGLISLEGVIVKLDRL